MGCVQNIDYYSFPKQTSHVNRRCRVSFNYDISRYICGTIIRDDSEAPFETLIKLDDGRTIRATECQYGFVGWVKEDG